MALNFRFQFLGPFWRKMGVAAMPVPKVGPRWGPFGSLVISKSCSQTLRPWTPPLNISRMYEHKNIQLLQSDTLQSDTSIPNQVYFCIVLNLLRFLCEINLNNMLKCSTYIQF